MTKIFEHGNWSHNEQCPICGTDDDRRVVLIRILGTEDGQNMQAVQVHLDCLLDALRYVKTANLHFFSSLPLKEDIQHTETEHED